MADNKDVELRIRARDYSQKTFKELTKVYESLIKVQQAQAEASEKGEASARDLEATYKRLEDAGRQLLKLDALTKVYQRQSEALAEASDKADKARQRQQKLSDEYNKTEKVTKRQTAALASATKAVESANRTEERRRQSLANTAAQLQRYGVDTNKVGESQQQFIAGVNQVNAALERQEAALEGLAGNQAAARMRQQAEKAAEDEVAATNKVVAALQRQADQALATSRGYRTLGRVVSTTTGSYNALGLQIQSIIAPAETARKTLSGLESQINDTAKNTDQLVRNTGKAKDALRELAEAQRRLVAVGSLVEQFRQQNAQLRAARGEYSAARADLRQLSAQLNVTGADHVQLGQKIQQAQQRLNTSAQALRSQAEAARKTQAALRAAGIETNKLAEAENRLVTSANRSVTATERLTAALRKKNNETKNASGGLRGFLGDNRESLSMFQRVRGELIALATAYVGLQGVINLAGGSVDAFKLRQQTLIKLSAVVGNSQEALGKEWEYIIGLSGALGLRIEDVAGSYSKFAVASKEVGISMQETKFIFESTAKAARVFQLSADDTRGVFRALEQILGKGQVYAEELRGQLGERLPAAVALFAKGMGITIAELQKQLEAGAVGADEVINFARAQGDAIASQLDAAAKGLGAAEARLANAQFQFKLAIADAGFIDSYTNLIVKLTEFLQSEQGTALAEKLAVAFSAVADAIIWAANNTDTLISVFATLAAVKIGVWLGSMAVSIARSVKALFDLGKGMLSVAGLTGKAGTNIGKATTKLGFLRGSMRLLLRLIPGVGAALIAWDIGKILYNQSETAKSSIDSLISSFKKIPIVVQAALMTIPAILKDLTFGPLSVIENALRDAINGLVGGLESLARTLPVIGDTFGDAIRDTLSVAESQHRGLFKEIEAVWSDAFDKMEKMQDGNVKKDKSMYDKMIQQAKDFSNQISQVTGVGLPLMPQQGGQYQGPLRPQPSGFQFTADPGTGPTPRMRQIRQLTTELQKLQEQAEKANKSVRENLARRDLPGRLALVDEEFAPFMSKARGIGGDEGAKLVAELEKIIALRKESERLEFEGLDSDKRLKQIERLRAAYEKMYAEIGAGETKIDPNATFEDRLKANLDKMKAEYEKVLGMAGQLGGAEGSAFTKQFEDLRVLNAELVTEQTRLAEIKYMEDQLTAQLNTKKHLLAEVNSLREAGLITEQEAVARTIEINAETNGGLAESIRLLEEFALKMQSSLTPEAFARINAELAAMKAGLNDVSGTFTQMDMLVTQGVLDGLQTSLNSIVTELTNAAIGVQSIGEAFRNIGATVAKFFADFLMKIAQAILQQMILNALASSSYGGLASAAVSLGGVATNHNGGIVGDKSSGSGSQNRGSVPASWFAGAKRYHSGGFPGLRPDEVPTILQKGEQVLSKDDPNNVLNQVGQGGSSDAGGMSARFVLVDDRAKVPEAMNSAEGEQVFMQFLKRNRATVRNIMR